MASRENHKAQGQGPPTISQGEGDLQQLIAQTTALLSPAGYSEKSISNYTQSGFSRLASYFDLHETHLYDEVLLNNFINETRAAYDQKLITRYVYQNARKAAMLLKEFHDTGTIQWHYISAWKTRALTPNFARAVERYCEVNAKNQTLMPGTIATSKSAIRQFLFCAEEMGINDLNGLTRSIVNNCITFLAPQYPCGMKSCNLGNSLVFGFRI